MHGATHVRVVFAIAQVIGVIFLGLLALRPASSVAFQENDTIFVLDGHKTFCG